MAKKWVIEAKLGRKWLTPWGWTSTLATAMTFRTKEDADWHIQQNGIDGVAIEETFSDPVAMRAGVREDYDPFGYRGRDE